MGNIILMSPVITVSNLTKKYGSLSAVDKISFLVNAGEVFGLLGENGAGKTTTLEMIEGLRKPSQGKITVFNHDTKENSREIKERIGVQLQSSAYYRYLKLKEILDLFGSFYSKQADGMELLKMVGLETKANDVIGSLSGGQKQRFSIVASLVNDPEIVFLDEPTTGLDPIARRRLWDNITAIKKKGKTIILTTHYMEEAEILCDRIAIMEAGKIVAMDDTHKLIENAHEPFKISFIDTKITETDLKELKKLGSLKNIAGKKYQSELYLKTQKNLNNALGLIHEKDPESITVTRASLEDVFVELTGKKLAEDNDEDLS